MDPCIFREGTVVSQEDSTVKVRILASSACAGCHGRHACGSAESSPREIEVRNVQETFLPGEIVRISLLKKSGFQAVWVAYLVPVFLVLATLILAYTLTGSELMAALSSLLSLLPYYAIVFLFEQYISRKFQFRIQKMNATQL